MQERTNGDLNKPMEQVSTRSKKIIVGQDHLLERLLVALLARGHILVEGVAGLAKTMAIKTLADTIGGQFQHQYADLCARRPDRRPHLQPKSGDFNTWWALSLPTCCWRTRSTAHRPRCRARCWR